MRQRPQVQEVLRLDRRGVTGGGGEHSSGDGSASAESAKLSASWVARQLLGRALLPAHALRRIKLRRNHARTPTVEGNAQLLLYSRMLPGDFLHYGYFDDPTTPPEAISFDALYRAQLRYARKVVEAIGPPKPGSPVLDAGSGMGGMLAVLKAAGHEAIGLTPDRHQVEHLRRAYPDVPVMRCRFEDLAVEEHEGRFGTILHAESIQYMDPERVFGVVDRALAPGGRWIVADYFRASPGAGAVSSDESLDCGSGRPGGGRAGNTALRSEPAKADLAGSDRSGWSLAAFREGADRAGYCIAREEDMTPHVVPTLAFARLLAERIGLPVFDFATEKLRAKRPAAHYVLEPVANRTRLRLLRSMDALSPKRFSRLKRYLLMTIHRK